MNKASIVIATRNRAPQLRLALESIRLKNYRDVEVVVIDDASTEETASVLRDYGKLVHVERIERPGGYRRNPSSVLNVGHLLAKTDIVIEQGGEICHLTDCVTPLYETCRPGVVALARVYHGTVAEMELLEKDIEDGKYVFPENVKLEIVRTLGKHWPVPRIGSHQIYLYTGKERPAPFLFLGAIHQKDFSAIGGYDENITTNNDGDLANRLSVKGMKFCFVGNAVAFHLKHGKS